MDSKSKVKKSKRKKSQEVYEDNLFESDDTFAFVAGYTSGGAPYGMAWEEMEEIKRKENKEMEKREIMFLSKDTCGKILMNESEIDAECEE